MSENYYWDRFHDRMVTRCPDQDESWTGLVYVACVQTDDMKLTREIYLKRLTPLEVLAWAAT